MFSIAEAALTTFLALALALEAEAAEAEAEAAEAEAAEAGFCCLAQYLSV